MRDLPLITIVIVTLNNTRTIRRCLESIRMQKYPKDRIDFLNVDGGSSDETVTILKQYGFRSIKSHISNNAEAQRAIGLKHARNNLIVSIDADNYLPHELWLRQMIEPFMDDPNVVHAGTLHFHYDKKDTVYNRYCALFGMLDPVVFYIGKPDRSVYYENIPRHGVIVKETENYFILTYSKDTLPTVGCNGVAYRKDTLVKHAKSSVKDFLHIDVFSDLVDSGFNSFAVVKTDVFHDTAVSIPKLLKKRIAFLEGYFLKTGSESPARRYLIFDVHNVRDRVRLALFVFYTLTFVRPFIDSVRGYISVRDPAWFLHPIMCFIYLVSYALATIKRNVKKSI